jgi:pimeloyl-ACP methyl ester carboxylesterase
LRAAMAEQAPRYAGITAPITIIAGEVDKTVSTHIHSQPLAKTAKNTRLIVLEGVGHMIQYAAPDLVVAEIEAMADGLSRSAETAAAAN